MATLLHEDDAVSTDLDVSPTGPSATDVLVPVSVTAARERERLRHLAGRRGPAGWWARLTPAARYLGSAEAAENGLRYRPVAWTVIAVVAVAAYLPGRVDRAPAQPAAVAPPAVTAAPPTTAPADDAAPGGDDEFVLPPPAPIPPLEPAGPAPSPAPVDPLDAPGGPVTDGDAGTLTIRNLGWASRVPSIPVPIDPVEPGTAPVANRLGSVDRVSFLRLDGEGSRLVLVEHDDSARELLGPAVVAVCPIVDSSWRAAPGQSFDEAPEWDEERCVGGVEDDGTWTFDLATFTDVASDNGFALVPTADAPPDFQIAFIVET